MPASPIRKLVPYADAAKAKGTKVFHLNIGQPDIETPAPYWDAVKNYEEKVLAYSHSGGIPSFRAATAGYYQRNQINITSEDLLITTGGSEALRFAFLACLNPGDEVIIPEPFYANYNGFGIDTGVQVVPITTKIEENFDLPDIEEFEALITPRTKAILICNPANPTGKLYSREALDKLRNVVKKHDLYLFADEVYREFAYDGLSHFSTMNLEGIEQNVVMVDSISKRFSACGARIGALVSRNKSVISAAMKFAQARLSPPTLGQVGAEAVMELPQSYYDKVVTEYCGRRDTLVAALKKIPGVTLPQASGAFYLMVKLPVENSDDFAVGCWNLLNIRARPL